MAAGHGFAKLHLDKSQYFWSSIIWKDEPKTEMFDHDAQCLQKTNPSAQTLCDNCQAQWCRGDELDLFCSYKPWAPNGH